MLNQKNFIMEKSLSKSIQIKEKGVRSEKFSAKI